MKKAIKVLVAFAVVFSVLSLSFMSVSADTDVGQGLTLKMVKIRDSNDVWREVIGSTWRASGDHMMLTIPNNGQYLFHGMLAEWQPAGYMNAPAGHYLKFDMVFHDSYTDASWLPDVLDTNEFVINLITNDGKVHLLEPYAYTNQDNNWTIGYACHVEGEGQAYIKSIKFYTGWPSMNGGTSDYTIDIYTYISTDMTQDMKEHQEVIGKIDASTQAIVGAIKDQTDTLTNGWGTGDDSAGKADSVTGDMANAESSSLGGKSDSAIKGDISGALGYKMPSDSLTGAKKVATTFDSLLNAFGSKYQSVLLLALTLGLAAFLVGKSYRAKGD